MYNDKKYVFEQIMDKNYYVLYSKDEYECVAIIINIENKIAEIHSTNLIGKTVFFLFINEIDNYTSCLDEVNTNVSPILLKITLKMIKNTKINLISIKFYWLITV